MLQRIIGLSIGALIALILLVIMVPDDPNWQDYLVPLVIGQVAAFFWPVVIAFWLGRRARDRQQARVEAEVQKQLDEERKRSV